MKQAHFLLFVVYPVVVGGCLSNRQGGRVAVTTTEDYSLPGSAGSLVVLKGNSIKADGQPTGPERPLLSWLLIYPHFDVVGSSDESNDGDYITTRKKILHGKSKDLSCEIKWDRSADTVTLDQNVFDLSHGNVFVQICKLDGKTDFFQIESEHDEDAVAIIARIKHMLPNNESVQEALSRPITPH